MARLLRWLGHRHQERCHEHRPYRPDPRLPRLLAAGSHPRLPPLSHGLLLRRRSLAGRGRTGYRRRAPVIAEALLALEPDEAQRDWRNVPAGELIDYLLARFHERHRDQFPELIRLASRVEQVHGSRPECPNGLAQHLWHMQQELESHMLRRSRFCSPCCSAACVSRRPGADLGDALRASGARQRAGTTGRTDQRHHAAGQRLQYGARCTAGWRKCAAT